MPELKSPAMPPKEYAPVWKCRHCKYRWLIADEEVKPKRCPNRECRRTDWDRAKIKEGRPRHKRPAKKKGKK